jgi:hypothetical protein
MFGRVTVGVLAASLTVAGCGVESPVAPLPTEAATIAAPSWPAIGGSPATLPAPSSPGAPPTTAPSHRRTASSPRPSRTSTQPPPASPACQGAVVRTIDLTADELALIRAFCLAVGAVLRIENIGPGEVTIDAPNLVDQNYEAGVVEVRFVRTGTVVVTIPQNGRSYDVTVVVR